jgi:hypothetical protein
VAYGELVEKLVTGESWRNVVGEIRESLESERCMAEYIAPVLSFCAAYLTASERGMRLMIAVAWITAHMRMVSYIQ